MITVSENKPEAIKIDSFTINHALRCADIFSIPTEGLLKVNLYNDKPVEIFYTKPSASSTIQKNTIRNQLPENGEGWEYELRKVFIRGQEFEIIVFVHRETVDLIKEDNNDVFKLSDEGKRKFRNITLKLFFKNNAETLKERNKKLQRKNQA